MEFVLYDLPNYVYNRYRKITKNNENISYELAQKKLSRNIALAKCLINGEYEQLHLYGSLLIKTKKDLNGKRIVGLWNRGKEDYRNEWELHIKKFKKLNKRLGIPMEVS